MSPEELQQLLDEQTLKGEPSLKAEQLTSVDAMLKSLANNSKIDLPKQMQVIKDGVARNQMSQAQNPSGKQAGMFPSVLPIKHKVIDDDGSEILPSSSGEQPSKLKEFLKDSTHPSRFNAGYFLDKHGFPMFSNEFEQQGPAGKQNMLNNQAIKDNESRMMGLLKSISGGKETPNPEMNKNQYELMDLLSEKEDPNVPNFNSKLGELSGLINHLRGSNLPEGDKQAEWDNGGRREAFLEKNPMTRLNSTINNTLERLGKKPLPKHLYSYSPDIEKDTVMNVLDRTRFSGRTPPLRSPEGKMLDDYNEANVNQAEIENDPDLLKLLEQKYGVK